MADTHVLDISEHRYDNGLTALLLEARTSPVICVSVWYRVGSKHDPSGCSGMAHMLEHMMFKGTARYPKGEYDRLLHAQGAIHNASTWLDRTNYYILVGSDRYEQALALEADRMRGARLAEEDLEDERRVVLNELDRSEDDPGSALFDRLLAMAFLEHPYRRPVIGWRRDVEALTLADLRTFYDTYYLPNNAYLTVVGDFDTPQMIRTIETHFGALPAGTLPRPRAQREPRQRGERRFELCKAGQQAIVGVAYHAPQRDHQDAFALDVLALVLGHGRTSRLYKALVESELAVSVAVENQSMPADPFLVLMDIEPIEGVVTRRIEDVLDQEIERLTTEPITERELERARKRARVEFVMRRDSVSALAFLIGELEAASGWRLLQTYLERLERVTPEHVMDAARTYLVREERTWGHFRPVPPGR